MPAVTSQIPGNGANSILFAVPGNGLDVETVYVEVDASAAAGAVTAELTIQDQSGVVIARKTQGETIAAGGTGSATWALRLDDESAAAAASTWQGARYTGGTTTIAKDASASFAFAFSAGAALLDLTVPAAPTFLASGVYVVSQVARCVIALGGAQVAGTSFAGTILIVPSTGGIGQNVLQRFTWPSGGTFVPQVLVSSVPINVNAGDALTAGAINSDSAAGNHVYDSPSIWVVKQS